MEAGLDFHFEAKVPDRFDVHRIECAAIVLQIALGRRLLLWQRAETAEFISGNIRSGKLAQSSDFARGRKTKLIEVHAQKMIWHEISPKIDSALICAHPILERGGRRLRFRSRRFQTEKERPIVKLHLIDAECQIQSVTDHMNVF